MKFFDQDNNTDNHFEDVTGGDKPVVKDLLAQSPFELRAYLVENGLDVDCPCLKGADCKGQLPTTAALVLQVATLIREAQLAGATDEQVGDLIDAYSTQLIETLPPEMSDADRMSAVMSLMFYLSARSNVFESIVRNAHASED